MRARGALPALHRPPLPRQRQVRRRRRVLHQADASRGQLQHRIVVVGLLQQSVREQLIDIAAHFVHRRVAQQPEGAQLACPRVAHLLAVAAAQHVGHVRGAKALADPRDARENLARQRRPAPARPRARPDSSRRPRTRRVRSASPK